MLWVESNKVTAGFDEVSLNIIGPSPHTTNPALEGKQGGM